MVLWADTCCIVYHDLNYIMAVKHSHSFSLSSRIVLWGTIMQYTQETWKPLHYSSTIQEMEFIFSFCHVVVYHCVGMSLLFDSTKLLPTKYVACFISNVHFRQL